MKLSDTDIAVLFQHASRRRFAAASVIIREGAKPESLYWLVEGRAAVRLPNWRGQDVTLGYFETGDFFGEMGLLPSPGERTARVQAVTDCAVLEIGYGPFRKLASTHDQLWLTLLGQVAERLRQANRRLVDTGLLRVSERIKDVLSEQAQSNTALTTEEGCLVNISRQELAQLVGCSREVVSRLLHQLEDQGWLQRQGRRLLIKAVPENSSIK